MSKMLQLPKIYLPDFGNPRVKPIGDVEIDWSNPLTRGLTSLIVFNEGSGDVRDLAQGLIFSKDTGTWIIDSYGRGLNFSSTGIGIGDISSSKYTKLAIVKPNAVAASGNVISSNGTPGSYLWTGSGTALYALGHASNFNMLTGSAPVVDEVMIFGATYRASDTTAKLFEHGILVDSTTSANSFTVTDTNVGSLASSNYLQGKIYLTAVFDVDKTEAEMMALSTNPYSILKPKQAMQYFVPDGVISGFQPAWAVNSNGIIQ